MRIQNVSFGKEYVYPNNYRLETKKGEPISKPDADKVVKRNMAMVAVGLVPAFVTAVGMLATRTKKGILGCLGGGAIFTGLSAFWFLDDYSTYKKQKDAAPERFYKWGSFKVIREDKPMD